MSQISSTNASGTLTAFFDERDDAEDAVNSLVAAGIPQDSIRLVPGNQPGSSTTSTSSTGSGHQHKGFFEALADFFMPDEDRYTYAEGLNRGGYLVTVTGVWGDQYDRALDILDDEGAIDLDAREQEWRSSGWSGYEGSASQASYGSAMGSADTASTTGSSYSSDSQFRDRDLDDDGTIPVVQEELRIGKRDVSHGRVRVRSYVVEEPVNEQVSLSNERVVVERRPVDRALGAGDAAFAERELEAEEHAEEAVVQKTARVTEEIGLRKEREQRQETISDTVRHTEVEVEDDRSLNNTRDTGTAGFGSKPSNR